MPWYNGNYPPSYKNQPVKLRDKAVEIANNLLENGVEEGIAIATGLKQARAFFDGRKKKETVKKPKQIRSYKKCNHTEYDVRWQQLKIKPGEIMPGRVRVQAYHGFPHGHCNNPAQSSHQQPMLECGLYLVVAP